MDNVSEFTDLCVSRNRNKTFLITRRSNTMASYQCRTAIRNNPL